MKKTKTIMQARMQMYRQIRDFFDNRAVCEVETPILSPYGSTDVHIDSFTTQWAGENLYLHTSPEFAMKCLLSEGIGDCFQIAKVFRNESAGRNHRPEFTLLEWYRIGFNLQNLMDEVAELVQSLSPRFAGLSVEQRTYSQVFQAIGVDAHNDDIATLKIKTQKLCGYLPNLDDKRDEWLDFLLVTQIEKTLGQGRLTFLTHYPASMAALARHSIDADGNAVAERFELYYQGIELANGFDELTDATEQLARFHADNRERKALGKAEIPPDMSLIKALEQGMPACAGVAVGLDRLLMLALDADDLDSISPFGAPTGMS